MPFKVWIQCQHKEGTWQVHQRAIKHKLMKNEKLFSVKCKNMNTPKPTNYFNQNTFVIPGSHVAQHEPD